MNTEEVSVAIERLQRQKSDDGLIEAKSCADNLSRCLGNGECFCQYPWRYFNTRFV
jgi:hypothetical protein